MTTNGGKGTVTKWIKKHVSVGEFFGIASAILAFLTPPAVFAFWLGTTVATMNGDIQTIMAQQRVLMERVETLWDTDQRRQGREDAEHSRSAVGASIGAIPYMWYTDPFVELASLEGEKP